MTTRFEERSKLAIQRLGLITAVSFVWLCATDASGKEFTYQFQRTIPTRDTLQLSLTCQRGVIEISSHDAPNVVITAVKRISCPDQKEADEVAEHLDIKLDQTRNQKKLAISVAMLDLKELNRSLWKKIFGGSLDSYGSIDFSIAVPNHCSISIDNLSGTIAIAETVGDVSLRSSASDIHLTSVEGAVTIDNGTGTTVGELLFGPVTVRQPTGTISLQWIEGDVRVKSLSANIELLQERGALDLTSTRGNVRIQTNLNSDHDYYVETESGDINLLIPEESSGRLAVASTKGNIRADLPVVVKSMTKNRMVGEIGSGGVKITLNSISGDVRVAQFQ